MNAASWSALSSGNRWFGDLGNYDDAAFAQRRITHLRPSANDVGTAFAPPPPTGEADEGRRAGAQGAVSTQTGRGDPSSRLRPGGAPTLRDALAGVREVDVNVQPVRAAPRLVIPTAAANPPDH